MFDVLKTGGLHLVIIEMFDVLKTGGLHLVIIEEVPAGGGADKKGVVVLLGTSTT